jgi:RimJ/RimL family protein N-acetyltransferase
VRRLDVYVAAGNTRARTLYERAGFRLAHPGECENEPAGDRGLIQYVRYLGPGGDDHGSG